MKPYSHSQRHMSRRSTTHEALVEQQLRILDAQRTQLITACGLLDAEMLGVNRHRGKGSPLPERVSLRNRSFGQSTHPTVGSHRRGSYPIEDITKDDLLGVTGYAVNVSINHTGLAALDDNFRAVFMLIEPTSRFPAMLSNQLVYVKVEYEKGEVCSYRKALHTLQLVMDMNAAT